MFVRRRIVIIGTLVSILGLTLYLAYDSPLVRRWLDRDADNDAEKQRAAAAVHAPVLPASSDVGWPQWRGPHRDGHAPEGTFRTNWDQHPPELAWKVDIGGGYSSMAVRDGKLYTQDRQDNRERIVCFDAGSGRLLWDFAYSADYAGTDRNYAQGPRATPTIEGNYLYAVGAAGKCLCLELPSEGAKPRLVWEHDLLTEFAAKIPQWGVACSPLIEGDLVVVQPGGANGSVVAINKQNGLVAWKAGTDPSGYSSPIAASIGNLRVIYALTAKSLFCLRAQDGAILDQHDWLTRFGGNIATPIVLKDYVFVSSGYGKGCALFRAEADGEDVTLIRVYNRSGRLMQNHHSTCVLKDGFLYGFDESRLKCIDFANGTEQPNWDAETFQTKGCLILADRYLIVLTERGELGLIEATPNEFRPIAKLPSGLSGVQNWSLPVLAKNRLYLRDNAHVLCLDLKP